MRTKARRDLAEPGIVKDLRASGAYVKHISSPDAPDLIVKYRGKWTPLGIKTGKGRLTKTEKENPDRWPIVSTSTEAFIAVGILR